MSLKSTSHAKHKSSSEPLALLEGVDPGELAKILAGEGSLFERKASTSALLAAHRFVGRYHPCENERLHALTDQYILLPDHQAAEILREYVSRSKGDNHPVAFALVDFCKILHRLGEDAEALTVARLLVAKFLVDDTYYSPDAAEVLKNILTKAGATAEFDLFALRMENVMPRRAAKGGGK